MFIGHLDCHSPQSDAISIKEICCAARTSMGPLEGIRIVELAGIGPGPFCAMLLSDMGAEIIRVDRAAMVGQDTDRDGNDARFNLLSRGRRNIAVDLKNAAGVDATLR